MRKLHPVDEQPTSPFARPPPPPEALLETENLISVLATTALCEEDVKFLKERPVFSSSDYDKFNRNVRAVRQDVDTGQCQ